MCSLSVFCYSLLVIFQIFFLVGAQIRVDPLRERELLLTRLKLHVQLLAISHCVSWHVHTLLQPLRQRLVGNRHGNELGHPRTYVLVV